MRQCLLTAGWLAFLPKLEQNSSFSEKRRKYALGQKKYVDGEELKII